MEKSAALSVLGAAGGVDGIVVLRPVSASRADLPFPKHLSGMLGEAVPLVVLDQTPSRTDAEAADAGQAPGLGNDHGYGKGVRYLRLDIGQLRTGLADYADMMRRLGILQPLFLVCDPLWFPFVQNAHSKICVYYASGEQLADAAAGTMPSADKWLSLILERYADGCIVDGPATRENLRQSWPLLRNVADEDMLLKADAAAVDAWLASLMKNPASYSHKLDILMLCAPQSLEINTVREYVESFLLYSRHNFKVVGAPHGKAPRRTKLDHGDIDYNSFDVLMVHYSARICVEGYLDEDVERAIEEFAGYKVLFIQDEYNLTENARRWMERMSIHLVFTVVPEEHIDKVYPRSRFPHTEFRSILTGYVPIAFQNGLVPLPLEERPHRIVYRGNLLPFFYGALGREKATIGMRMKAICQERGLSEDIEWERDKKINGTDWYGFLQSGRATLGTESGTNVFDIDGILRKQVEDCLRADPDAAYEDVYGKLIESHEEALGFKMNQISPKFFEFISSRTALILFPGTYSGILEAEKHYIPLEKDFSNVDEVLGRLEDIDYLKQLTDRAFDDVIASGRHTYKAFVEGVDAILDARVKGVPSWTLGHGYHFMLDHALSFRDQVATAAQHTSFRHDNLELDLLIQLGAWKKERDRLNDRFLGMKESAAGYRGRLLDAKARYEESQAGLREKLADLQQRNAALRETSLGHRARMMEMKERYEAINASLRAKIAEYRERVLSLSSRKDGKSNADSGENV